VKAGGSLEMRLTRSGFQRVICVRYAHLNGGITPAPACSGCPVVLWPVRRSGYFRRHGQAPRRGIVLLSPLTVLVFEEPSEYEDCHSAALEGFSTSSPD